MDKKPVYHFLRKVFAINLFVPLVIFLYNSLFLTIYNPYINQSVAERFKIGIIDNIFIFVFIAIATPCSMLIAFSLRPVKLAIDNPSLIEKAKKRILIVPLFIFIVHMSGFLSGPIVTYLLPSNIPLNDFIYVFMVSIFSGLYSFAFSFGLVDYELNRVKRRFAIHYLSGSDKDMSIVLKFSITIFSAVALTWSISQYIGYYYYKRGSAADMGEFLMNSTINILLILIASLINIIVNAGSITAMIKNVRTSLADIFEGKGDLTKRLNLSSFDEIGGLISDFNKLLDFLMGMIKSIKDASENIEKSSVVLSDCVNSSKSVFKEYINSIKSIDKDVKLNSDLSNELIEASNSMIQTMSIVNENIGSQGKTVQVTSSSTEQMLTGIKDITETVVKTNSEIHSVLNKITASKKSLHNTIKFIQKMGDSSKEVLRLIDVINDIYERIKLLAINASIEAARAGNHGVGFEVVAGEVRKLSDASASGVANIALQVKDMNKEIYSGAELVNLTVKELEEGFDVIVKNIEAFDNISVSMEEQNSGTRIIMSAMNELVGNSESLTKVSVASDAHCSKLNSIVTNLMSSSKQISGQVDLQRSETLKLIEINQNLINASANLNTSFDTLKIMLENFKL